MKAFVKWEKKRKEKDLKKLQEHKYKCLESEEFKIEFARANLESPNKGRFYSSKFRYFKKSDQKKLKSSINDYFNKNYWLC